MHIDNLYSLSLRFVSDKLPKLVKRPAMQAGAHPFVGPDPQADIFQIFKDNSCTTIPFSFQDNFFGNTVIHVGSVTSFLARDLPQSLLCRLRTVALKTFSVSQKFVSSRSQKAAAKYFASTRGSQIIFSKIDGKDFAIRKDFNIGKVKDKVKKPELAFPDKLSLLDLSPTQILCVIGTDIQLKTNPSAQSK
jgi:hypothetical protein